MNADIPKVRRRKETCSACNIRPVRGDKQRYCKECHAEAEKIRQKQLREDARAYRKIATSQ
jgi:hypothetical protein